MAAVETVIGEIGTDTSRFPTASHLLSWAGLVPRLEESAGKRRSTRIKKGAPWLKPVSAMRLERGALKGPVSAPQARRGPKKATIAIAASVLTMR